MPNLGNLKKQIPSNRIRNDLISRHAYARDAGFYRLLPELVVKAETVKDVSALFKYATEKQRKIGFRAGGTSLSGQALSDDILVEIKGGWRSMAVLDGGRAIILEPGVIAAHANLQLAALGYRIGPDPGSIQSACIGGIVANNASGIGSGTWANSYQTLRAMEMVLPNGLVLNTENPLDDEKFHQQTPEIYTGLLNLRARILQNRQLLKRIQEKYKLKNTVGYGLNSFIDFERPIEILAHLMVGSEGTLGFISKVTLKTVPLQPLQATAFVRFDSLEKAAGVIPALKRLGIYACEILDAAALQAVLGHWHEKTQPETIISPDEAALLLEFQENDQAKLDQQVAQARDLIHKKYPRLKVAFSQEKDARDNLWKTRRELGPIHAATRPPGTTVLSEDVCFHPKHLAKAIKDLKSLFKRHGYTDAVIFGHAGDGNLHFKLSLDLSSQRALTNYSEFMEDMVTLVVDKYDGSLKAEHGTGRNMAPFIEREWGSEAYAIMKELKVLLDPLGILNPGVIISQDPLIHLKHIKPIPLVDPLVYACIECGLCEPACPSSDLSLTPRQRIVILREMEMLRSQGGSEAEHHTLNQAFQYKGIDTCAGDGLCALACPINIDTGRLVKNLRLESRGPISKAIGQAVQNHTRLSLRVIRSGLQGLRPIAVLAHRPAFKGINKALTKWSGGRIPLWNPLLRATRVLKRQQGNMEEADLVYFPSCVNRVIHSGHPLSIPEAFADILAYAGLHSIYPQQVKDLCCGLGFQSKGLADAAHQAAIHTTHALWENSDGGRLPIVMDTSPCTYHLMHYDQILSGTHLAYWRELKIMDMVEYLHDQVLADRDVVKTHARVVLHPTCSNMRNGLDQKLESLARKCATTVIRPTHVGCCGMAGDRGMFYPELPETANLAEVAQVKSLGAEKHYSTSRMCEIGLSSATEQDYLSIVYLVHDVLINGKGQVKND